MRYQMPFRQWTYCLLLALTTLWMLALAPAAFAQSCSVDTPHTANVTFPKTVNVPRDTPVGTLLTSWVEADSSDNWTCSANSEYGASFWFDLAASTTDTVKISDDTYAVVQTNIDGVGIIAKVAANGRSWATNGNPPTPFTAGGSVGLPGYFIANKGALVTAIRGTNSGSSGMSTTMTISLALVKTTATVGSGTIKKGTLGTSGVRIFTEAQGSYSRIPLLRYAHSLTYSAVNVLPQTCTTPNVAIAMGDTSVNTFKNTGEQTSGWKTATFNVNNCPAGMTRVRIMFSTPSSGWLDETNRVFKLSNPTDANTAKGVGMQLGAGNDSSNINVFRAFDEFQTLSGYSALKNTGGSFSFVVASRYVKPASTTKVTAGTANGAVVFTMSYE